MNEKLLKSLKDLIKSTPAAASLYEASDDAGVARLLNIKDQRGPVPIADVSSFVLRTGVMGSVAALDEFRVGEVFDVKNGTVMSFELKALLKSVTNVIDRSARLEFAHLDEPDGASMLAGLVAAGLLTSEAKAAMLSLADNRLSLAEVVLGLEVHADDVSRTRGI